MAEKQWQGGTAPMVDDLGNGGHVPLVKVVNPSEGGTTTETNWATTYGYTDDRITSETRTAGSVTQTRAYTYDAAGNLTGIGAWA